MTFSQGSGLEEGRRSSWHCTLISHSLPRSLYLSLFIFVSLSLCLHLCVFIFLSLPLCLYLCLFIFVSLSLCLYLCAFIFVSLLLSLSQFAKVSLSLSLKMRRRCFITILLLNGENVNQIPKRIFQKNIYSSNASIIHKHFPECTEMASTCP